MSVGIRENMNKNPAVATGATLGIILICILIIVYQLWPSHPSGSAVTKAYFTDDDGKTYFKDDVTKFAPFDHDGKEAVQAFVYQANGGTPFVAFEEKLTPEALNAMKNPLPHPGPPIGVLNGTLVKRPGDKDWTPAGSAKGQEIVHDIKAPGGSTNVSVVMP